MKLRTIDEVLKEFPDAKSCWKRQEDGSSLNRHVGRLRQVVICDDDGKPHFDRYIIDGNQGVTVVPYDTQKGVIRVGLIQQERPVPGGLYLQAPMGQMDENETVIDTARRELLEETGLEAIDFEVLGKNNHCTPFLTGMDYVVAAQCEEIIENDGVSDDKSENIVGGVKPYTFRELKTIQNDGGFVCGMTKSALLDFGFYLPAFFKE